MVYIQQTIVSAQFTVEVGVAAQSLIKLLKS